MIGTHRQAPAIRVMLRLVAALVGALTLAACNRTTTAADAAYPLDYRERHPITLRDGERTVEIFLGRRRGGLLPEQRADVLAFAQNWRHESTSGIVIEVPRNKAYARSAGESMREVHAILAASGIPRQAVAVRGYYPDPAGLATIRISYARLTAHAGPCGLWPEDLGVSIDSDHNRNRPYWNFGCATQRNLASMVANPADLVQPRGEGPVYAGRRTTVLDKYRTGEDPSAKYQSYSSKGNISDLGKQ
jgi:pilus assembly protein CpaD